MIPAPSLIERSVSNVNAPCSIQAPNEVLSTSMWRPLSDIRVMPCAEPMVSASPGTNATVPRLIASVSPLTGSSSSHCDPEHSDTSRNARFPSGSAASTCMVEMTRESAREKIPGRRCCCAAPVSAGADRPVSSLMSPGAGAGREPRLPPPPQAVSERIAAAARMHTEWNLMSVHLTRAGGQLAQP